MCGIAGWFGTTKSGSNTFDNKLQAVKRAMQLQAYRGPDANGLFEDRSKSVVLGHNRLSIVELSDAGSQPMVDNSGNWVITYNGELYNHDQLRNEIAKRFSVVFKGKSDTEVVLYGVKHYGVDEFLRRADGMFAFCILNKIKDEVILARDRVGEKPLYYFYDKEGICFASELKALLALSQRQVIMDKTGLHLYLLLRYVPAPYTILSGFCKLKPGHYIKFTKNCSTVEQVPYFSWDPHASEIPVSADNYKTVVQSTLKMLIRSLESRLMADVPLGFFSLWRS